MPYLPDVSHEPNSDILAAMRNHTSDSEFTIENVSEENFDIIAQKLEGENLPFRFYYDANLSSIVVCGQESPVHESIHPFFNSVFIPEATNRLGEFTPCEVRPRGAGKVNLFNKTSDGTASTWMKGKHPDHTLEVIINGGPDQRGFPTIVVEVGYSETYGQLKKDVDAWLLGSLGYVRCAILIKLQKPERDVDFGESKKWNGFIEVWHREVESGWVIYIVKGLMLTMSTGLGVMARVRNEQLSNLGRERHSSHPAPTQSPLNSLFWLGISYPIS